jgi:hypothetical protein
MTAFAAGSRAIALCDRCGFQYRLVELKKEWNGLKTCIECWEVKHPQLDPRYPPTEPQALWEPRPSRKEPIDVPVGDEIFPFMPNEFSTLQGVMQIGIVEVEIT